MGVATGNLDNLDEFLRHFYASYHPYYNGNQPLIHPPNNDSGQDWGDGVLMSTSGCGERFGEGSLPFEEFASRLYIFHFDPLERGELADVDQEERQRVVERIYRSWGASRLPAGL